jgi:hypothetical protein
MTHDERAEVLRWFGYTPRQAAFLATVLVHGGYFLRRHFAAFLGRQDGGLITDFVQRLVRNGHGRRHVFRRNTEVFHVFARRLYQSIDEPDCRYRREVSLATMVERLMVIDLVLAHGNATFLATEREKVNFVLGRAPAELFPGRWTSAPNAPGSPRTHVFVDKAPLFLEPTGGPLHVPYMQGPAATLAGFGHLLKDYERLLTRIEPVTVVFCTAGDHGFADAAATLFARWRTTRPFVLDDVPESIWRGELVAYFEARRRVESARGVAQSDVDATRLASGRLHFAEPRLERLYDRWTTLGHAAIEAFCVNERVPRLEHVGFRVEVLPHRYGFFGSALRPLPRTVTGGHVGVGSPERSP